MRERENLFWQLKPEFSTNKEVSTVVWSRLASKPTDAGPYCVREVSIYARVSQVYNPEQWASESLLL